MKTIRSAGQKNFMSRVQHVHIRLPDVSKGQKHVYSRNIFQPPAAALLGFQTQASFRQNIANMSCHHLQHLGMPLEGSSETKRLTAIMLCSNLYNYHLQRVVQHSCSHDIGCHLWLFAYMPILLAMYLDAIATRLCLHSLSWKLSL